jgi:hypothetical protein
MRDRARRCRSPSEAHAGTGAAFRIAGPAFHVVVSSRNAVVVATRRLNHAPIATSRFLERKEGNAPS